MGKYLHFIRTKFQLLKQLYVDSDSPRVVSDSTATSEAAVLGNLLDMQIIQPQPLPTNQML